MNFDFQIREPELIDGIAIPFQCFFDGQISGLQKQSQRIEIIDFIGTERETGNRGIQDGFLRVFLTHW